METLSVKNLRYHLDLWQLLADEVNVKSITFNNEWKFEYDTFFDRFKPRAYNLVNKDWKRII